MTLPPLSSLGAEFPPYRPIHPGATVPIDACHAEIAAWPVEGGLVKTAVPGFLRPADALALYELAWFADGDVLELGSAWGLSTGILCHALRNRNRGGKLVSIELDPQFQRLTRDSITASGLGAWHELLAGDATALLPRLAARKRRFGFLFIDHDHAYPAVRAVCSLLPALLLPGSYALFHDFNDIRNTTGEYGVYRAVAELVERADDIRFAGVIGCCGLVQRVA